MSIKNFSDILASEMLNKLASKEHRAIFGSQDASFAEDECENCGCHKDECKCGDMAYANDGSDAEEAEEAYYADGSEDSENSDEKKCGHNEEKGFFWARKSFDLKNTNEEYAADSLMKIMEDCLRGNSSNLKLPSKHETVEKLNEIKEECDGECTVEMRINDDSGDCIVFRVLSKEDKKYHVDDEVYSVKEEDEGGESIERAASYLISASEALDAAGFSKSAMDTLHLAKLVIAAKKKKMKEKSSKEKASDKSSKKTAPKDANKSTKSTKPLDTKKKDAPSKKMEKFDSSKSSKEKSSAKKSNPFKSSK